MKEKDGPEKDLIAALIPAHNEQTNIGRVVCDSRKYLPVWVVDDGSTDDTAAVVATFTDSRIVYVRQGKKGEASARNAALDLARGEYVDFLDADDLYLSNALSDMTAFLATSPEVDALFSDGFFCDENGQRLGPLSDVRPGPFTGNILEPLVLDATVIAGIICTMTRRSIIENSGVRFDPTLVIGPDWDFWIQLARVARFGYLDKLTCMYRVHDTNITRLSGSARRKQDLVRGRLKVMNADWFGELSLPTRQQFFYGLLIGLLSGDSARQQEILASAPFLALPDPAQATLLRHVASDCLLAKGDPRFSGNCLRSAMSLWPADRKSRFLLGCLNLDPSLCRTVLTGWQFFHKMGQKARTIGKRTPRPVPAALAPFADASGDQANG